VVVTIEAVVARTVDAISSFGVESGGSEVVLSERGRLVKKCRVGVVTHWRQDVETIDSEYEQSAEGFEGHGSCG
jgi:hypothetical protein